MDSRTQSSATPDCLCSTAPVSPSRGVKRERSVSSETGFEEEPKGARPSEQLKRDTSTVLSEENLREFEAQNVSNIPPMKRSLSRRSTAKSDITSDSRGSGSSINLSTYRFQHLAAAKVRINSKPPDHIKAAIDAILEREPTQERRDELKIISKEFHTRSSDLISASDGEDDSVRVLLQALQAVKTNALRYQEKADWREELKPLPPQPLFSADFLRDPPTANDTSDEPRKRQQLSTDEPQPSDTSQGDPPHVSDPIPPPINPPHAAKTKPPPAGSSAMEREGDHSSIKTPRPDVSIGINMTEITSCLASSLGTARANELLPWLRDEMKPDKRNEPLLISVPASRASCLTFPLATFEGKAYSTGKPIFEAQNQASVSGACALKIQLDLEYLARQARKRSSAPSSSSRALPLLFFSVCTEGPYHELWAHYTKDEDGVPTFNSTLRKICHGSLLDTVEQFMTAFDNVCSWGTGEFLEIVVESLITVANAAITK